MEDGGDGQDERIEGAETGTGNKSSTSTASDELSSVSEDVSRSGSYHLEQVGEREMSNPLQVVTSTALTSSPLSNVTVEEFLSRDAASASNSQASSNDKSSNQSKSATSEEDSSNPTMGSNASFTSSSQSSNDPLSATLDCVPEQLTSTDNYRDETFVTNRFFIHQASSWRLYKYELVMGNVKSLKFDDILKATLKEHVPSNVFVDGIIYSPIDLCPVVGDKYKLKGQDEGDEESVWLCKVGVITLAQQGCGLVCREILRQILIESGLTQCGNDYWLCHQNSRVDVAQFDVAIFKLWKLTVETEVTGICGQVTDCTEIVQTGNIMSEIMRLSIRFPNYDDYETKVLSELMGLKIAVRKGTEDLNQATRMTITSVVISPPGTNPEQFTIVKCGDFVVNLREAHRIGPTSTQMASSEFRAAVSPITEYTPNRSFNFRQELLRYMENSPHVQQSYQAWGWTKPCWEFQSKNCFVLPFPQIKTSVNLPNHQPSSTNPSWKDLIFEGGVAVQARKTLTWTYVALWKDDLASDDILCAMKRHITQHRYLIGKRTNPVHMSEYTDYMQMIKDCSRQLRGACWSPSFLFLVTGAETVGAFAPIKKIFLHKFNIDSIIIPLPPSCMDDKYFAQRRNAVDMIVDTTEEIGKKLVVDVMVKLGGLPWTLTWSAQNVMMVGLSLGDMSWDPEKPVLGYAATGTGIGFRHTMGLLSINNDEYNGIGAALTKAMTESAKYFQAKNRKQDVRHVIVYGNYSTELVNLTGKIQAAVENAMEVVEIGSPSVDIALVETDTDYRLSRKSGEGTYANVESGTVKFESDGFWLFPTYQEETFNTPTKFTVTSSGQELTMFQMASLTFLECCHFYQQYSPIGMPSVLKYSNQTINMAKMGIGLDLEDFDEKYWVF